MAFCPACERNNMFNLDQAILEWRRQMLAAGIKNPVPLEELEIHLRGEIDTLRSSGVPEVRAFEIAVSRLGTPCSMQTEFNKVKKTSSNFVTIVSFAWIGMVVLFALLLLGRMFSGKLSFLLFAHIFSLTAGYTAALLTGGFGIGYVCCQYLGMLSPARGRALSRAVFQFSWLSAGLVVAGLLFGMFWSGRTRGHYSTVGDAREIGTLCVSIWLIVFWMLQRFGQARNRTKMLLSIVGNLVVSLAWFGAGVSAHGYGLGNYWPIGVLLGVHLFFLVIGIVQATELAEA
jgi:hypothetical protein